MAPHVLRLHSLRWHGALSRAAVRQTAERSFAWPPTNHAATASHVATRRAGDWLNYFIITSLSGRSAAPPLPPSWLTQLSGCLAMLLRETSDGPGETSEPAVCTPARAASSRSLFFPSWEMPAYQVGNQCVRGQVQAPPPASPPCLRPSLPALVTPTNLVRVMAWETARKVATEHRRSAKKQMGGRMANPSVSCTGMDRWTLTWQHGWVGRDQGSRKQDPHPPRT